MIQGQTLNTDEIGTDLIGKTIETTFANGATVTDRVVAVHVEVTVNFTGATGAVRRAVLFEHVRPSRAPLDISPLTEFADWFELQPNTAIHVLDETEPTK